MKKITCMADAFELAKKMVIDNITVQLWDKLTDNCLIECVSSSRYGTNVTVLVSDTVNDTAHHETMTIYDLVQKLWRARAFINHSDQLQQL